MGGLGGGGGKGGRGKHCFWLVYGFCSNNAFYTASLSFIMLTFIWPPFDTWDCYHFASNFIPVLLVKVLLTIKAYKVVF